MLSLFVSWSSLISLNAEKGMPLLSLTKQIIKERSYIRLFELLDGHQDLLALALLAFFHVIILNEYLLLIC